MHTKYIAKQKKPDPQNTFLTDTLIGVRTRLWEHSLALAVAGAGLKTLELLHSIMRKQYAVQGRKLIYLIEILRSSCAKDERVLNT